MTQHTFTTRSNAIRAARRALGEAAVVDVDFTLTRDGDLHTWHAHPADVATAPVEPKVDTPVVDEAAQPETVKAKTPSGDAIETRADDPLLWNGVRYGNRTRLNEAKRVAELKEKSERKPTAAQPHLHVREHKPVTPPAEQVAYRPVRALKVEAGQRPAAPDFTADTHKGWRKLRDRVVAAADAGDLAGLQAIEINPVGSSRRALVRYRDAMVIFLGAAG